MQIRSKNDEKQSVEYRFEDKNRKNLGIKLRSIIFRLILKWTLEMFLAYEKGILDDVSYNIERSWKQTSIFNNKTTSIKIHHLYILLFISLWNLQAN